MVGGRGGFDENDAQSNDRCGLQLLLLTWFSPMHIVIFVNTIHLHLMFRSQKRKNKRQKERKKMCFYADMQCSFTTTYTYPCGCSSDGFIPNFEYVDCM